MSKLKELLKKREATYVEKTPQDVYRDVAHDFDNLTPEDIAAIGKLESEHGKYQEPLQGGSARGLFQFQPNSAEHLIPGSSESLSDRNTQAELLKKNLKHNAPESVEDAYLMHNLGRSGGKRIINADDEVKLKKLISNSALKGNSGLYGEAKTVGDVKEKIKKKIKKAKESTKVRPSLESILKGE